MVGHVAHGPIGGFGDASTAVASGRPPLGAAVGGPDPEGVDTMAEKDEGTGARKEGVERPQVAVTATSDTERREGLAFDVEPGTELPGVPTGDQRPANENAAEIEENVRETGEVPPAHQRVPDHRPV
jgi:hypothetical protein